MIDKTRGGVSMPSRVLRLRALLAMIAALAGGAALFQPCSMRSLPADNVLDHFRLSLRTRVEAFKGSGEWEEVTFQKDFVTRETAVVICDMWDRHWCSGATRRVDVLAGKMAPILDQVRAHGILVIHAPSDTMDFYKDAPQRQRAIQLPKVDPPAALSLSSPPLPIDDSDGGCDTPGDSFYRAWTREHPALRIAEEDFISDNGAEIYSLLRTRGIKHLLVMGVHANMCILNRSFAIKQMTRWGIACVLVRDLTDAMYNPKNRPYVPHDQGTELVVQYIEKYWCPSALSQDLVRALAP
jgi:nicotinamidase-related amidase